MFESYIPAGILKSGFHCGSAVKESACNVGSIPGLGRSPGEGKGYPLQYSGLENFVYYTDHGVAKSGTWLSDFHFILESVIELDLTQWQTKDKESKGFWEDGPWGNRDKNALKWKVLPDFEEA